MSHEPLSDADDLILSDAVLEEWRKWCAFMPIEKEGRSVDGNVVHRALATIDAQARRIRELQTGFEVVSTDAHEHGRFSRFLCWFGLHPSCCHQVIGMLCMITRCGSCGREDSLL